MAALYPAATLAWFDRWDLPDGSRVTVRPVLPQDRGLERQFVAQALTARSRYQRFHTGLRELPDTVAQYLTQVDQQQHVALVVEHAGPQGPQQVADARFVRDPDLPQTSEFGLAVADAWQGLGLGRRLLHRLRDIAVAQGLQTLYGDVLRDNQAMLGLARSEGFTRSRHPDDPRLVRLQLPLQTAPLPAWAAATALRIPHPAGGPGADPPRRQSPAACA